MTEPKLPELNKLHGVTYEEYDSWTAVRSGWLKPLMRSPAHLRAHLENPKGTTEAMEEGKLIHSLLENGNRFLERMVVEPEFMGYTLDGKPSTRSKDAREKRTEWRGQQHQDAIIVTGEQATMLTGIAKRLSEHKLASSIVKDGVREAGLCVQDPETGLYLKCKPDLITSRGHVVDYKSTRDANAHSFTRDIFDYKGYFYVLQAAFYNHCLRVAGIAKSDTVILIAVEKEPPYGINVFPLDVGCLGPGEQWRQELLGIYKKCIERDEWPCYPPNAVPVVPPEWVKLPGGSE